MVLKHVENTAGKRVAQVVAHELYEPLATTAREVQDCQACMSKFMAAMK